MQTKIYTRLCTHKPNAHACMVVHITHTHMRRTPTNSCIYGYRMHSRILTVTTKHLRTIVREHERACAYAHTYERGHAPLHANAHARAVPAEACMHTRTLRARTCTTTHRRAHEHMRTHNSMRMHGSKHARTHMHSHTRAST